MRGVQIGSFLLLIALAAPVRAEEGGRTVAADPGLAFGDWGERVVLDLPPAARDTKPEVVLVASHRAVDTEVGSGWRLQATSVIRRRSLTNGVPQLDSSMAASLFQIDGMELVNVTGPGAAHYQPETYDGSRLDYDPTGNRWTRKRDGWTWTYGDAAAGATRSIVSPLFWFRPGAWHIATRSHGSSAASSTRSTTGSTTRTRFRRHPMRSRRSTRATR